MYLAGTFTGSILYSLSADLVVRVPVVPELNGQVPEVPDQAIGVAQVPAVPELLNEQVV